MPPLRTAIALLLFLFLVSPHLQAQPVVPDSASTLLAAGGETGAIVYHRYRDLSDLSAGASVSAWRFTLRDGGTFFGDADRFPTVLDTLRIAVRLLGSPAGAPATRSISWAGIYSVETTPRLLAVARIVRDSLLFEAVGTRGIAASDDLAAVFQLRLKFSDTSRVGDRLQFSIAERDAIVVRGTSSRFARFGTVQSSTGGSLDMIVTTGLRLVVSSPFPDTVQPGVRFGGSLSLLDSADNPLVDLPDSLRAFSRTGFGALSGDLAVVDSAGMFTFDSLSYPFRNDSAVFGFAYPGADTLDVVLLVSGGAATVPTVAHIRPGSGPVRAIDGTGVSIESDRLDGVFLFERIERTPASAGALPGGVSRVLARYLRITALPGSTIGGRFRLGLPIDGLSTGAHPASMRLMYRTDSLASWLDPATTVERFDAGAVYGSFDSTGEFALGTNVDLAVPVTGLTVAAEAIEGGGARLRWRTKTELDNAGFVLRRATDRTGPFVTVDSYRANAGLLGAGSSAIGAEYVWQDSDPRLGAWSDVWYLLVEVSFDGLERVHGPIHLALPRIDGGYSPAVSIHPNPFVDAAHIAVITAGAGPVVLTLHDSRGAFALRGSFAVASSGPHDLYLPTDELPAGAYRYTIRFDGGEWTGVIIKGQ